MPFEQTEAISRFIIFDTAFREGIYLDDLLFPFDNSSKQSGISRRLAPRDEDVHEVGCATAAAQNERKNEPPSGPTRRYYAGFKTAIFSNLALKGDEYVISVELDGNGGPAHVAFELVLAEGLSKSRKVLTRAEASAALAEAFGPPTPHVCPCDIDDDQHPLKLMPDCLTRGVEQLNNISGAHYGDQRPLPEN